MSDTTSSFSGSVVPKVFDEEKTAKLYRSLKKMLQEVEKLASKVNSNYKGLEENMNYAAELITAIQINENRGIDQAAPDRIN